MTGGKKSKLKHKPNKEQSIEPNEKAVEWLPDKFLRSAPKFSGMTRGKGLSFPRRNVTPDPIGGGKPFLTPLCHS